MISQTRVAPAGRDGDNAPRRSTAPASGVRAGDGMTSQPDLILVGGGLANSLIAYRVATLRPDCRVLVIERGPRLGGDHTWSFHAGDLEPAQHGWLAPFVEHSWPGYEVRFPGHARRLGAGYASFGSARLHDVVSGALGERVRTGVDVVSVSPREVVLAGGERLRAGAVLDGRGDPRSAHLVLRYQKFLGQVLDLEAPHGLREPIIMDARIAQEDGYRFVYTLPYGERRLLVEDTRYSDSTALPDEALREEIARYANACGWRVAAVHREERGILPIVLSGDIDAFWDDGPPVARTGLRAALFHPTTGYSLPEAVRLADDLCGWLPADGETLYRRTRQRSVALWRATGFFRLLNRMLFLAGRATERYRVLERFYRLPEPLIHRFYAGRITWADRARLLSGAPPVPVGGALRAICSSGRAAADASRGASAAPGGRS